VCTYLVDIHDLTGGLLHLPHLVHEVPEAGLGHDLVGGEDLHAVSRRVLVGSGGHLATHHLVQSHGCRHLDFTSINVMTIAIWWPSTERLRVPHFCLRSHKVSDSTGNSEYLETGANRCRLH